LKDTAKWTDVAIVVLTFGIVFLALMQWRETHSGSQQTDRIVAADERLARANEQFAAAMGKSAGAAETAANTSRALFESSVTPRVGVEGANLSNEQQNHSFLFVFPLRNFLGGGAARNVRINMWGTLPPFRGVFCKPSEKPSLLYPGQTLDLPGFIGGKPYEGDVYDTIFKGSGAVGDGWSDSVLTISIFGTYDGQDKGGYEYCSKEIFYPRLGLFINAGSCDLARVRASAEKDGCGTN
jgi:hypothetical protein